jgi:hypothetical protein
MVSFPEFHRPVRNTTVSVNRKFADAELQLTDEPLFVSWRIASSKGSYHLAVWHFSSRHHCIVQELTRS